LCSNAMVVKISSLPHANRSSNIARAYKKLSDLALEASKMSHQTS